MEPRFFLAGDGRNAHIPHPGSPRIADWGATSISHSNTPHHTHLAHIDEDALEGVYFAFSTIVRCLPYFLRKTRPRASYELLEAFSSSLAAYRCGWGFPHPQSHTPTPHTPAPHLTPYRRGCPRRGLFRVFDHPKVFVLLFSKNAS